MDSNKMLNENRTNMSGLMRIVSNTNVSYKIIIIILLILANYLIFNFAFKEKISYLAQFFPYIAGLLFFVIYALYGGQSFLLNIYKYIFIAISVSQFDYYKSHLFNVFSSSILVAFFIITFWLIFAFITGALFSNIFYSFLKERKESKYNLFR